MPHSRWATLFGTASGLVLVAAVTAAAQHDGGGPALDHLLLSSDFVGLLEFDHVERLDGGAVEARVVVVESWSTRWDAAPGSTMTVGISGEMPPLLEEHLRAVVFLRGGAWVRSPLTYPNQSFFALQDDGSFRCFEGSILYALASDGVVCAAPTSVDGPPLQLGEFRAQFLGRLSVARRRFPERAAELDRSAEPLFSRPNMPPGSF